MSYRTEFITIYLNTMFSWKIKGIIFLFLNLFFGLFFQVQKLIVFNYPHKEINKSSNRISEFIVLDEGKYKFRPHNSLFQSSKNRICQSSTIQNKIILSQNSKTPSLSFIKPVSRKESSHKVLVRGRRNSPLSPFLSKVSNFDLDFFQKNQFQNYRATLMKFNLLRRLDWFTSIHPSASPPYVS